MKIYNEPRKDTAKILIIKTFISGLSDLTSYGKKLKQFDISPADVIYVSLFDKEVTGTLPVQELKDRMDEVGEFLKIHGNINVLVDETGYKDIKGKYSSGLIFNKIWGKDVSLWKNRGVFVGEISDIKMKAVCGFRGESILREMPSKKVEDSEFVVDFNKKNIIKVTDGNEAMKIFKKLHKENDEIYFDTETSGLRWEEIGSKLLTIQFTGNSDYYTSYVLFIDHTGVDTSNDMKSVVSKGTKWLLESGKNCYAHNANFDLLWIKRHLCEDLDFYKINSYDTMLLYHFLTNTYVDIPLGLKPSAFTEGVSADWESELSEQMAEICKERSLKKEEFSYEMFDVDLLLTYSGLDTIVLAFYVDMLKRLNQEHPAYKELNIIKETWENNWQNIMQSIQYMILNGVPLDMDEVNKQIKAQTEISNNLMESLLKDEAVAKAERIINSNNYNKAKIAYEKKCEEAKAKGKEFKGKAPDYETGKYGSINFDVSFSPASVAHKRVLFIDVLRLPPLSKTPTGAVSVGSADVSEWVSKNPDLKVLTYFDTISKIAKELGTYLENWKYLGETSFDGKLRGNFTPTATSLRLRSRAPALLNISKSDIKKCIRDVNGNPCYESDYSGLEDWTMLFQHQDPIRMEMKRKGIDDAHVVSAKIISTAFKDGILDKYDVTNPDHIKEIKAKFPHLRQNGKALSFGMAYGQSVMGIAMTYKISEPEAKAIYDAHWNMYKGEREYILAQMKLMSEQGYIINYGKSPLITKGITEDLNDKVNMGYFRSSYNSIGQSSAWATLRALDKSMREAKTKGLSFKPFLSVYDSILYTNSHVDSLETREMLLKHMTAPIMDNQPMPLRTDFSIGNSYKMEEGFEGTDEELREILDRY